VDDHVLALFEDFAAARARGERPDPGPYLERAGDGAADLAGLIMEHVGSSPPPDPLPEVVAMMEALVDGEPPLLGARLHRRLGVDAVVAALLGTLGIDASRAAKVKRLYQRLEGGLIDTGRLDPRLTAAIGDALGIRPRDVALGSLRAGTPPASTVRFARVADPASPFEPTTPGSPVADDAPDEIDRLFGLA
jgi:hypothetical protein